MSQRNAVTLLWEQSASSNELEQRIRRRAHELYEQRGQEDGRALEDWFRAECEIKLQRLLANSDRLRRMKAAAA
jgi:Protein of unknown function (DUF2934)